MREADQGRGARHIPGGARDPAGAARGWTRRRLALAAELTAEDVDELRKDRSRWASAVAHAFAGVDILLLPTIPVEAPAADGADTVATTATVVPYTHLLLRPRSRFVDLLRVPHGAAPVGVQLAAARGRDGLVLRAGAVVQAETDWHRRRFA